MADQALSVRSAALEDLRGHVDGDCSRGAADDLLDGREFTASHQGCAPQRGPLMLVYLTDVRSERVVIIQVNWLVSPPSVGAQASLETLGISRIRRSLASIGGICDDKIT
jgi:hypothetical protein